MSEWGSFPDTLLHFRTAPPLVVDLRKPVSQETISRFRSLNFERAFGVVTAENPMGVPSPVKANLERAAELRTEVAKLQVPQASLDACSPDGSHCEESVAVAMGLGSLIAIADRYDQLAVFWFDGDAFWIEPARSRNARLRLPVHT